MKIFLLLVSFLFTCLICHNQASAENTEERFQDIFITAGYATAIGAGLGATGRDARHRRATGPVRTHWRV